MTVPVSAIAPLRSDQVPMVRYQTEEDVEAIAQVALVARKAFPRNIAINATPYVPKAQTTFQWAAMQPVETLETRVKSAEPQALLPPRRFSRPRVAPLMALRGVIALNVGLACGSGGSGWGGVVWLGGRAR